MFQALIGRLAPLARWLGLPARRPVVPGPRLSTTAAVFFPDIAALLGDDDAIRRDVTVAIRQWFANRTPVLARLCWLPTAIDDFVAAAGELQHCQAFHFRSGVSARAGDRPGRFPGDIPSPFSFNLTMLLQDMVDNVEHSLYYGSGRPPKDHGPGLARTMKGLRTLIGPDSVARRPGEGRPADLFDAMLGRCGTRGGRPDVMLIASDFARDRSLGFRRVPAGETVFGRPILVLDSPSFPGLSFIECPLMRKGDAAAIQSDEVLIRNRDNPRLILTPGLEAAWACTLAIEVVNPHHHCWAETREPAPSIPAPEGMPTPAGE